MIFNYLLSHIYIPRLIYITIDHQQVQPLKIKTQVTITKCNQPLPYNQPLS